MSRFVSPMEAVIGKPCDKVRIKRAEVLAARHVHVIGKLHERYKLITIVLGEMLTQELNCVFRRRSICWPNVPTEVAGEPVDRNLSDLRRQNGNVQVPRADKEMSGTIDSPLVAKSEDIDKVKEVVGLDCCDKFYLGIV